MALPYTSIASTPQGLESVTINAVAYVVDAVSMPSVQTRTISRTDANGDAADFIVRASSDQVTGSLTLQRALTTTVLPPSGVEFTYDFDRSGTASTLVITNNTVDRGGDAHDTFSVDITLVTYQG